MINSPSRSAREIAAIYSSEHAPKSTLEQLADAKTQFGTFMGVAGIERALAASSFTWSAMKQEVITAYVVMQDQHARAFSPFMRVLFTSAFSAFMNPPRANVLFLGDEYATSIGGAGLAIGNTGFTVGRGKGLRMLAVLQSWAQTREIFGDQTDTMVASSGVIAFMRPRDAASVRFIRERAGDRTVLFTTEHTSVSEGAGPSGNSTNVNRSSHLHIERMPLYREQDLYAFGAGATAESAAPILIFMDGASGPVEGWTLPYWHPGHGLQGRFDPNPYAPGYVAPAELRRPEE